LLRRRQRVRQCRGSTVGKQWQRAGGRGWFVPTQQQSHVPTRWVSVYAQSPSVIPAVHLALQRIW